MHYRLDHYRDLEYENGELREYMSTQEVMDLLYISRSTLYRLLRTGQLKGFRVGSQWRVAREEFQKFCGG